MKKEKVCIVFFVLSDMRLLFWRNLWQSLVRMFFSSLVCYLLVILILLVIVRACVCTDPEANFYTLRYSTQTFTIGLTIFFFSVEFFFYHQNAYTTATKLIREFLPPFVLLSSNVTKLKKKIAIQI